MNPKYTTQVPQQPNKPKTSPALGGLGGAAASGAINSGTDYSISPGSFLDNKIGGLNNNQTFIG